MSEFLSFVILIAVFALPGLLKGKKKKPNNPVTLAKTLTPVKTVTPVSAPVRRPGGSGVDPSLYSSPSEVRSDSLHDQGHTHDRLDYDCYTPNETEAQHYKKQLDSFYKAGLIERSEYNLLFKRYTGR